MYDVFAIFETSGRQKKKKSQEDKQNELIKNHSNKIEESS